VVEVTAAEDQMMIQQFAAGSANPSLGERISARSPVRQADHSHSLAFEDLVERRRELGVPIMEQDPRGQLTIWQLPD
jgi:hypothetical protein